MTAARYSARVGPTMWGARVVIWDNILNAKADTSKSGDHVWPKTKAGWADANLTASHLSLLAFRVEAADTDALCVCSTESCPLDH